MKTYLSLTKRNVKMFFKDKGMFLTSLITPVILLVLYVTFLANVYRDSFMSSLPDGVSVPEKLVNGMVGGELISSLLAVCCVTIAFCSNLLMVSDKITDVRKDFLISPVKKSAIATSYFSASLIVTLIITYAATLASFIYIGAKGWYLSFADVALIFVDVFLLTAFGTALSSVVNVFLKTQGQASAVGTIVSAGYGFICGAYMPISSFGKGLQNFISLLPGTYGTSLIRNHALNGVYREMANQRFPEEVIEGIKDGVDCNIYFFGDKVSAGAAYGILIGAIILLIGIYVLINVIQGRKGTCKAYHNKKENKAKKDK
ncbi:MAG: ABC transporter permease [Eubacteriales bacterium]|nr:ABC transporter permease [Eubacteriales bacterium]